MQYKSYKIIIFTIFTIFVRFCLKYYESDHGDITLRKERMPNTFLYDWILTKRKLCYCTYVVVRQVCFGESDRPRNRQNRRANRQKERKANKQVCLGESDRQIDKTGNTEELR